MVSDVTNGFLNSYVCHTFLEVANTIKRKSFRVEIETKLEI